MVEVWKDIPKYENKYQVSDMGNVKSLNYNGTGESKVMKLKTGTDGRRYIILSINGKTRTFSVHRLVALTFIGPCPNDCVVTHSNGDHLDDKLDNLIYDTQTENVIDIYRHDRKNGNGKVTVEQVVEIRNLHATGTCTQKELTKMYEISKSQVNKIITRKCFKYVNDDGTIQESETAIM